ncbi:metallophosphoesterase [Chloroflexota bacterium]
MKIGVMSDTHDRIEAVDKAIDLFNSLGLEEVLHAGDLVSPFVAGRFSRLRARLHYVWGNNEGDRDFIRTKFGEIGIAPLGDFAALELGNRKIALLHGTSEVIVDSLAGCGTYDIVVRGHSHKAEVVEGNTLLVNPGEVCGYLSGRRTVAVIDLIELSAEIVDL